MSWLALSPGKKVKVGLTFETPDDQFVATTADPEVQATAMEGAMDHEVTQDIIDEAMGMKSMSIATFTVMSKTQIKDDLTLMMSKDELRRHIYECTAILKAMDRFGGLVDEKMKEYIEGVRKKAFVNENSE